MNDSSIMKKTHHHHKCNTQGNDLTRIKREGKQSAKCQQKNEGNKRRVNGKNIVREGGNNMYDDDRQGGKEGRREKNIVQQGRERHAVRGMMVKIILTIT